MKVSIIILVILLTTKSESLKLNCTEIFIKDKFFDVEIIREGVNNIRQLAINRKTNVLYFSYDLLQKKLTSKIGYINLDTNESGTIEGVKNARAVAVDHRSNKVYIGGETGLYELNNINVPIKMPVDDNVIKLFIGDDSLIYYTTIRKEAYKYSNGEIQGVFELFLNDVDYFAIDNTGHVFFVDNKRLFRVQLNTRAVNIHEKYVIHCLNRDVNGDLYICEDEGVYMFNRNKYVLVKVAKLGKLKDLVFDKFNEPIYAVYDKIIKLNSKANSCVEK